MYTYPLFKLFGHWTLDIPPARVFKQEFIEILIFVVAAAAANKQLQ